MPRSISELSSELRIAIFRTARRLRAEKADDDLSDGQFSVLAILYRQGPHTLGALAALEKVSAPSMNRTVDTLEADGYVARTPNADDGRKVDIALTEEGTATVKATVAKRDAWMTEHLRAVTPEERAVLERAGEILRSWSDA